MDPFDPVVVLDEYSYKYYNEPSQYNSEVNLNLISDNSILPTTSFAPQASIGIGYLPSTRGYRNVLPTSSTLLDIIESSVRQWKPLLQYVPRHLHPGRTTSPRSCAAIRLLSARSTDGRTGSSWIHASQQPLSSRSPADGSPAGPPSKEVLRMETGSSTTSLIRHTSKLRPMFLPFPPMKKLSKEWLDNDAAPTTHITNWADAARYKAAT